MSTESLIEKLRNEAWPEDFDGRKSNPILVLELDDAIAIIRDQFTNTALGTGSEGAVGGAAEWKGPSVSEGADASDTRNDSVTAAPSNMGSEGVRKEEATSVGTVRGRHTSHHNASDHVKADADAWTESFDWGSKGVREALQEAYIAGASRAPVQQISKEPPSDVVDAVKGLFAGGFIDAGTIEHNEWSQELKRRLVPLRNAIRAYEAAMRGKR